MATTTELSVAQSSSSLTAADASKDEIWPENCASAFAYENWISGFYLDHVIKFTIGESTTKWRIRELIGDEKVFTVRGGNTFYQGARAVFICDRVSGGTSHSEAILKVYMQYVNA